MTSCDGNPELTLLSPAESKCLSSSDRRVPCKEENGCNGESESDFRPKCGDDVPLKVDELEVCVPRFHGSDFYERQDSLARAATLQEFDRTRDADGILNFLETTMNIDDYLEDIRMDHLSADGVEIYDFDVQKCNNLSKGGEIKTCDEGDSFLPCDGIQGHLLLAGHKQETPELKPEIKVEPDWEDNCSSTSSTHPSKREERNAKSSETYTPSTTARKYTFKTLQERNNASYKVKRQRNNDAVRKSRSKAKELRLMKEKQLEEALEEIKMLKARLRFVSERLSRCRCRGRN